MNKDIKTLRQYAKIRKLPEVIKLGTISNKLCSQLFSLSQNTEITNERSVENRQGTYGVEHDDTSPVGKTYNQKHVDNWGIDIKCLNNFTKKFDWRFAELAPRGLIPMHLDDPYSYRFLIILYGSHVFRIQGESDKEIFMNIGDVYFVNPAYRHSVENLDKQHIRTALLGKIEINEHNTELLRTKT